MLWSAFTLAFLAFLRSSEFTSPSSVHFNPLVHLSRSDISFTSAGSLSLQLKSSKTDPFRMGCSITLAPSGRSVCAGRPVRRYLTHQLPGNSTPFISSQQGIFSPGTKQPQFCASSFNAWVSPQSPMHPIGSASGLQLLLQRPACPLGLSKPSAVGPAIATPNTSGHLLQYSKKSLPS